ncbi:phosphodiesterase [Sporotomaculum syntrophicum]|uniref:Phosphodiesterase n=1 Tax=Sporotomaculum syntrophicum TaxID=182264 RepID=A0A9D2WM97_9FIRM|nr:HDIG domain-containing metalloprotein [Sporotomaculum syntrophicum]KAF1084077.1 phosphodiesterase [Sporotomaculum syntrophicum]
MLPLGTVKEKLTDSFSRLAGQRKVRRGLAACLFFVLLTLILSVEFMPQQVNLVVGQVSPTNVFAPRNVTFQDKVKTEEARNLAANQVEQQYITDPRVSVDVQQNISTLISVIADIQANPELNDNEKLAYFKDELPFTLTSDVLDALVKPDPNSLERVKNSLTSMINRAMEDMDGVTQENTRDVTNSLVGEINNLQLSSAYKTLASEMVRYYLRPNKFLDIEKTQRLQEAARETVPPMMVTIKEGEKIIGVGEIVTEEHIAKLEALGLSRPILPVSSIVGSALLVILLMSVVLFYLYQQNREIYTHPGYLYLMGIIVLGVLGVSKAIIAINITQWPEFGALLAYVAPVATAGMLIAILLDSRLAVLVVAMISFLLGLMTGGQIRFAVVGFIGGFAGVYGVSKLSQRGDMARAGFYSGAANVAAIFAVGLVGDTPIGLLLTSSMVLGTVNGLLSSILTNGAIPYLESVFGITSSLRLLELSNPGNPLLRRLQIEAPGTYHHSLLVGNLSEAAADAVGGDTLLVRVAAYYHDIGKVKRPFFFIENQIGGENPHEKIAPTLSTLILTSHVKDGVELAREHKLPQGIIEIIEQHHGQSMCSFFYQKAMENNKNESITEDDFRYEGPKPQTKEAAIVMLADAIEAATRAMQNRTPGRVEGLVHKIIKDKLMDGQLAECDLTMKDLNIIANSFIRVLSGIFHNRIEYPDMTKEIERRENKRFGTRKQLAGKGTG